MANNLAQGISHTVLERKKKKLELAELKKTPYRMVDAVLTLPLGKNNYARVTVYDRFDGYFLDIREWYRPAGKDKFFPTRRGVRFNLKDAGQLAERLMRLYQRWERVEKGEIKKIGKMFREKFENPADRK